MRDKSNSSKAFKPESPRRAPVLLREFYFGGMFYPRIFLAALQHMGSLTSLHIDCMIAVELPLDTIVCSARSSSLCIWMLRVI